LIQGEGRALKAVGCWTLTTALSARGCIDLESTDGIGRYIDEPLGLEEKTYEGKPAAEQGSEITTVTNILSTYY
jgi:hypothetical protein